jgi:hypothetical protein
MTNTLCKLCGAHPAINSHVLPGFAVRYLKKTGPTKYLRSPGAVNLRVEDGVKSPLLCRKCDGELLSPWEERFCQEIFKPYNEGLLNRTVRYGSWLSYFVVSLMYKIAILRCDDFADKEPNLVPYLQAAIEQWRGYLRREHSRMRPYEFRIFFFAPVLAAKEIPSRFHSYVLRGLDMSTVRTDSRLYIYALIPGIAFWATIQPPKARGWSSPSIGKSGELPLSVDVSDGDFKGWVAKRSREISELNLSERQQSKVDADIEKFLADASPEQIERATRAVRLDWEWNQKF